MNSFTVESRTVYVLVDDKGKEVDSEDYECGGELYFATEDEAVSHGLSAFNVLHNRPLTKEEYERFIGYEKMQSNVSKYYEIILLANLAAPTPFA